MDERRFEVKARLTAEEVVLFDNIRDRNGLGVSQMVRRYVKEGMARDATQLGIPVVANTQKWDGTGTFVRPLSYARKGTQ